MHLFFSLYIHNKYTFWKIDANVIIEVYCHLMIKIKISIYVHFAHAFISQCIHKFFLEL